MLENRSRTCRSRLSPGWSGPIFQLSLQEIADLNFLCWRFSYKRNDKKLLAFPKFTASDRKYSRRRGLTYVSLGNRDAKDLNVVNVVKFKKFANRSFKAIATRKDSG